MRNFAVVTGAALLVSACAGGTASAPSPARVSTPVAAAPAPAPGLRAPTINRERGLENIIGAGARVLTQRFGDARIDLIEGDARKLQFASSRCVLDIYLYPLARNAAPVATHVEARERQGGADTDKVRCIAEIERGVNR